MPGHGRYRAEFIGKTQLLFRVFWALLMINTFSLFFLPSIIQRLPARWFVGSPACLTLSKNEMQIHAPTAVCIYSRCQVPLQLILVGTIGLIRFAYRKNVRYIDRRLGLPKD